MTGLITHSSVLLLTRKRLERVQRLLRGKLLSGTNANEIERQVLFLAGHALQALNRDPLPAQRFDADTFAPWLATGASRFAVMGSVGPEIVRYAARFAPSQSWLVDTLRTGNPDPARSAVLSRSTDFLVALCERLLGAALAESDEDDRRTQLQQMRAYALGYACHIATSVVSAPFIDAVAAELGSAAAAAPREKLSAAAVRGALEESVARRVFRRDDPRGGDWKGWLPQDDEVPRGLFQAFADAASTAYGAGARVSSSKATNDRLAADAPPPLSRRLVEDGYSAYRLLTERGYTWTYGDWLKATLAIFLPPAFMLPLAAALPQGRLLRRPDSFFTGMPVDQQRNSERSLFEVLSFPLAANGAVPFGISLWTMLGSHLGVGPQTIFSLVSGSVTLVAAVAFFATLGVQDMPDWVRWTFLFALPLALEIACVAYVLSRGGQDMRHLQLALASLTHIGISLLFVILFVAVLHLGIEGLLDEGIASPAFWIAAVGWLVLILVSWLVTARLMHRIDSSLPNVRRDDFAGQRPHYPLLFDDTTLGHGPQPSAAPADAASTLAQRLFPRPNQALLRLWWEDDANPIFVRSDRHSLVFAFAADGSGTTLTLAAPIAPMSSAEFAALLHESVHDRAGSTSRPLKVERAAGDEPLDPMLGTGAVFADHGDDQETIQAYGPAAARFVRLPAANAPPYVLRVAPAAALGVRVGRTSGIAAGFDAALADGPGLLLAIAAPGSDQIVGDAGTRFLDSFVPGDVLETVGLLPADVQRVVLSIADDQQLRVNLAFIALPAGTRYRRAARNREADLAGVGTVARDSAVFRRVVGTGTRFERDFMPGDTLRIVAGGLATQLVERQVVAVLSATSMQLANEVSERVTAAPAAGDPYLRPGRRNQAGFGYAQADPSPLFAGQSLLDRAADLATLLCLGTSSRLLLDGERRAVRSGAPDQQHGEIQPAWQVFRNWNLDQRRANEWRMLISGGATSEKRGLPDRADPLQPLMPADLRTPVPAGEAVANRLGWVPLFTRWLDMAQRPASDSTAAVQERDAQATNLELSQGLAFLLDIGEPL